nr:MAG TPA: hypothetical protein [Caudoviricetes sp.]
MRNPELKYLIRNAVTRIPRTDFEDISYNAAVHATNVVNRNQSMDARVATNNSLLRP